MLVSFQSIPLCIRWSEILSFSKPALKEKNYSVHSHAPRAPFLFDPQENLACVYLILASASDSASFSSTEQLEKVM